MRLRWTILLLLPMILMARENPFASSTDTKQVNTTAPLTKAPKVHPRRTDNTQPSSQASKPKIHPQRNLGTKEVLNFSKARFVFRKNSAYIETKDKIIKHFSIANPPSIVIDFKGVSDFASKRKELRTTPFTKLEMGAHGNRYRVVLRLNKVHKYKINKRKYGQVITIVD